MDHGVFFGQGYATTKNNSRKKKRLKFAKGRAIKRNLTTWDWKNLWSWKIGTSLNPYATCTKKQLSQENAVFNSLISSCLRQDIISLEKLSLQSLLWKLLQLEDSYGRWKGSYAQVTMETIGVV